MTLPPLPEAAHEQGEDYSGIAVNKVVVTPLFTADQMRAYGAACAAAERERIAAWLDAEHEKRKHLDNHAAFYAAAIRAQETP